MTNRWMAMVLLTLTSCGDGIVGAPYRGDSLFSFEGIILTFLDEIPDEETTRVALGWSETSEVTFDSKRFDYRTRFQRRYVFHLFLR